MHTEIMAKAIPSTTKESSVSLHQKNTTMLMEKLKELQMYTVSRFLKARSYARVESEYL